MRFYFSSEIRSLSGSLEFFAGVAPLAAAVFAVFGRTNEDQFLVKRLPESLDSTADKRIEESYSAFFGNPLIYHNCKKGQQMDSKLLWAKKHFLHKLKNVERAYLTCY